MPTRPLIVLAAALAVLVGTLGSATAAPHAKARGKAPATPAVRTQIDGVASDWDAGLGLLSLAPADVAKGPRSLRRLVRRGVTVTLRITATTRLTMVDADGNRIRIAPADLFDALDLAADDVDVEAAGRLPRVVRAQSGEVVMPASRVVVTLPPALGDDPGADPDDPSWDDPGTGDDPPVADDPGADDPGDV
ncbi:MAG TPA: hypothetical protein PKD59_05585 [Miltoncostaeaceae bacterium]|nr:hypothetical protein [Miltoncostaeaceae bacterium]